MRLKTLIGIVIFLIVVTVSMLILNLYWFAKSDTISITPTVRAKAGEPIDLEINVNKYDRVYLIMDANITISEIYVNPRNILIPLPLDVEGIKYDIDYPVILQRGFFFVANSSGSARITLVPQPQISYAVKTIEGEVKASILTQDNKENITLSLEIEKFAANNYSQLLLVHPYGEKAEVDFQVEGAFKLIEGKIAYVNLILMTENEDWYAFKIASEAIQKGETIHFNVNVGSRELLGRNGEFLGRKILFIAFGIGLYRGHWDTDETPSAIISINNLYIHNGGKNYSIRAQALSEYDLKPRIYVFRKFTPSYAHILLVVALASEITALTHLALRWLKLDERDKGYNNHSGRV